MHVFWIFGEKNMQTQHRGSSSWDTNLLWGANHWPTMQPVSSSFYNFMSWILNIVHVQFVEAQVNQQGLSLESHSITAQIFLMIGEKKSSKWGLRSDSSWISATSSTNGREKTCGGNLNLVTPTALKHKLANNRAGAHFISCSSASLILSFCQNTLLLFSIPTITPDFLSFQLFSPLSYAPLLSFLLLCVAISPSARSCPPPNGPIVTWRHCAEINLR